MWMERDYRPVSELNYPYVTDLQTIRRVTECPDFPDFEVKELWYDKSDSNHSAPYMECEFKKEMTDEEFMNFHDITNNVYWEPDKDYTIFFWRGWSKKEDMEVPEGMAENMVLEIVKLNKEGFEMSYHKNADGEAIASDFFDKLTGHDFPPFEVIDYRNNGKSTHAIILFADTIGQSTFNAWQDPVDSARLRIDTVDNGKCIFFTMDRNKQYANLLITPKE